MRPNFLIILTDEERYPPCYEDAHIRAFRRDHLPGRNKIKADGIEFHNHYTSSSACSPSRASLFTGHYPSHHGVSQTYGGAKEYDDPNLYWLEKGGVPTMGNYFKQVGYDCVYKGKWHLSYEDIATTDSQIEFDRDKYVAENKLRDFGFDEWVGPMSCATSQ